MSFNIRNNKGHVPYQRAMAQPVPVMETRPMLRPRPRPIKQQHDYITEKKLFCCNTHVCY